MCKSFLYRESRRLFRGGVSSSLLYNEFIVYDVKRVQQRFVLQVKFHY